MHNTKSRTDNNKRLSWRDGECSMGAGVIKKFLEKGGSRRSRLMCAAELGFREMRNRVEARVDIGGGGRRGCAIRISVSVSLNFFFFVIVGSASLLMSSRVRVEPVWSQKKPTRSPRERTDDYI